MKPAQAVEEISRLFTEHGHHHYGESMDQIQHAVQAARLALADGSTEDMVLAAFLHDIGHLLVNEVPVSQRDDAIYRHQSVGADYLRGLGFSERVADLVERHVDGKRYLTAVDPGYRDTLSEASIESLGFQGGPMDPAEVSAFEALGDRDAHLKLRHWDDEAKNADDPDRDMSHFLEMAQRHLSRRD
jgi:phosphonate degradation associated HDIG domain protein